VKEPRLLGPEAAVNTFVNRFKLIKAGKLVVPYKTTEIESIQTAFNEFTSV
jgi:hypothetical protein